MRTFFTQSLGNIRQKKGLNLLASSTMKTFADDNFILAQSVQFVFERVENTVGKGENVGY